MINITVDYKNEFFNKITIIVETVKKLFNRNYHEILFMDILQVGTFH